jgi:hypothetical protein
MSRVRARCIAISFYSYKIRFIYIRIWEMSVEMEAYELIITDPSANDIVEGMI